MLLCVLLLLYSLFMFVLPFLLCYSVSPSMVLSAVDGGWLQFVGWVFGQVGRWCVDLVVVVSLSYSFIPISPTIVPT